jgi:hypothetical protein
MLKLPIIFNVLMLLFWVRLWSAPANEFYFNPFLSGTVRLTDAAHAFLRPVLRLPEQASALLLVLFVGVFKTLLLGRLGTTWSLDIGSVFRFGPSPSGELWAPHFLFSALDFAQFLLRLWTVFFLVQALSFRQRAGRALEAFAFFARPFSSLPFLAQPAALLALHGLLAFALSRAGVLTEALSDQAVETPTASPFLTGPLLLQALRTCWLGVLSFADGLLLLTQSLFVLILGNFVASLFQIGGAMVICHEAVEMLLGRFARNRGATGLGLDFTPLIFFFVVSLTYDSIRAGLLNLIQFPFFH